MIRTAIDYLLYTANRLPDKTAFVDEEQCISFQGLRETSDRISTLLIQRNVFKKPVAVFLEKGVGSICAFMGIAGSGNFYCPIDTKMPVERIHKILERLNPALVLSNHTLQEEAASIFGEEKVLCLEEAEGVLPDPQQLESVRARIVDTDILYILFTSGSTGMPKGVTVSHRGLIDFTEWAAERFSLSEENRIANQTPLYFSMSIFDVYQTLRNGSTTYFVPKKLFSIPTQLMEFLANNRIDTIDWVPSALCFLSVVNALDSPHVDTLKTVLFGGEVMPAKQLNKWIRSYPDVRYVNLYGPTEVTDTCTYYVVDREIDDQEMLPIGTPCINKDVLLLTEENELVQNDGSGTIGEICVRGSGLSYGYYNDPEKTREAFVQNPLQPAYPETIYRTGDLGKFNERGELIYVARKDFQIKHKGHRIELNEIETACSTISGVRMNCCLYDQKRQRIVLFYTGEADPASVIQELKALVPEYMVPGKRVVLPEMPLNQNGKIDRQRLKEML